MTVITVLATPHWAGLRSVEHTANVITPRASFNVTRVSLESPPPRLEPPVGL